MMVETIGLSSDLIHRLDVMKSDPLQSYDELLKKILFELRELRFISAEYHKLGIRIDDKEVEEHEDFSDSEQDKMRDLWQRHH